jgi:hypothetical protein
VESAYVGSFHGLYATRRRLRDRRDEVFFTAGLRDRLLAAVVPDRDDVTFFRGAGLRTAEVFLGVAALAAFRDGFPVVGTAWRPVTANNIAAIAPRKMMGLAIDLEAGYCISAGQSEPLPLCSDRLQPAATVGQPPVWRRWAFTV